MVQHPLQVFQHRVKQCATGLQLSQSYIKQMSTSKNAEPTQETQWKKWPYIPQTDERMTGVEMSQKWGAPDTPPKISQRILLKNGELFDFSVRKPLLFEGIRVWALKARKWKFSENSMGNFTGPCQSAKGSCSCNNRTTWDESSAKPLPAPGSTPTGQGHLTEEWECGEHQVKSRHLGQPARMICKYTLTLNNVTS